MNTPVKSLTYSAILCTFNAEDTVERAINSILNQTIAPNEIIIVDDHSNDQTIDEINKFKNIKLNLKIIQNIKNLGQSICRNIAAKEATGDVLVFFDDDDESLHKRAEKHLEMHMNSDISYVSSLKHYGNGYMVKNLNCDIALVPNTGDWIRKLLLGTGPESLKSLAIPCSTAAFKRGLFNKIGGFDSSMRRLEDVEIFLRSSLNNPAVTWSSDVLVNRYDSFGVDKGGGIDTKYEKELLIRYKKLLTPKEYSNAIKTLNFRSAYFEKKYLKLFLHGIGIINFIILNPSKVFRFIKRVIHDVRKIGK
jgi:glycosyltransferase involved in cell wall biosynthesis